jgi:hypothetical protein
MITFDLSSGSLSCSGTPFAGGTILFELDHGRCASNRLSWKGTAERAEAKQSDCVFSVCTRAGMLMLEVENQGDHEVVLQQIVVRFSPAQMEVPPAANDYLEYIHAGNFGELPGVKRVGLANRWIEHNPESSMVYVLHNLESRDAVLFSTLPPHRGDFVTIKALHESPHLQGHFGLEIKSCHQKKLEPGSTATASMLQCRTGTDPLQLLTAFGAQWREAREAPFKRVHTGWNSWDYYAWSVAAEDMHQNQAAATRHFGDRVRTIVIDGGWECMWGVWEPNWKFQQGLEAFCRKTRTDGGIPGIWTAPLLVNAYTRLYRDKPEWFARDANGQIAQKQYPYGPMSFLDITQPAVADWIFNLFKRLKDAGFEYFKVDFTQEVLSCESFQDSTVARGDIVRRAFETIRRAIGEDAYLLSCGAPYESMTGIVDAVRVTGDIHNFWSNILRSVCGISGRWWMQGNLWNIDPDFLIVRTAETSSHTQFNREFVPKPFVYGNLTHSGRQMNLAEAKVYALLVYLSAGDLFLGDNLEDLNEEGVRLLQKVLERPLTRAAVPVDLFQGHDTLPRVWVAEEEDSWFLGAFNWEEDASDVSLDFEELGMTNWSRIEGYWSGEEMQPPNNALNLSLPPRSCEGFRIWKP